MITKRWQICWPPLSDPKDIQITIWMGCFAALFYAGNWGLIVLWGAIYGILVANPEAIRTALQALIHLTIAASIGWGICKKYKAATIAGLILAIVGLVWNWISRGFTNNNSIIMLVNAWMFLQSTRGIFAYHRTSMVPETNGTEKA